MATADGVKALVFDVFGTVVDWHGSVAREVRELARLKGLRVNAVKFAKAWRAGYRPAMDRVLRGEVPFTAPSSRRSWRSSRSRRSPRRRRLISTGCGTG
jgi:FMN phosphatase YigB (HAD superfamily)